jgi:hypothetical protein
VILCLALRYPHSKARIQNPVHAGGRGPGLGAGHGWRAVNKPDRRDAETLTRQHCSEPDQQKDCGGSAIVGSAISSRCSNRKAARLMTGRRASCRGCALNSVANSKSLGIILRHGTPIDLRSFCRRLVRRFSRPPIGLDPTRLQRAREPEAIAAMSPSERLWGRRRGCGTIVAAETPDGAPHETKRLEPILVAFDQAKHDRFGH